MNSKYSFKLVIIIFLSIIIAWIKIDLYLYNKKIQSFVYETNFDDILASINAKDYINTSINELKLLNRTFNVSDKPKLSIIIPIYNKEKIIKRTISSIQNQNMDNFEIILVNDFSTDNTLSVIKDIQINEPRIKIIQNHKNMGTLYSRCIGTLSAKGKYILPLDNDDMYLYKYAFDDIFKEINSNNLDLIKFNGIEAEDINGFFNNNIKNVKYAFKKDYDIIIKQPNLSYYPTIRLNNIGNNFAVDLFLWLKCINTQIYKKAISLYNEDRYSIFMTSCEDDIMTYIIFQLAKSFKYIKKYCILHFDFPYSANKIISNESRVKSNIYYLDAVCDFSKNSIKGKEIILGIVINIMKFNSFINVMKEIKFKIYFNEILKKINSSEYISNSDKYLIKKIYYKITHDKHFI